jgi:hypothetical protein
VQDGIAGEAQPDENCTLRISITGELVFFAHTRAQRLVHGASPNHRVGTARSNSLEP